MTGNSEQYEGNSPAYMSRLDLRCLPFEPDPDGQFFFADPAVTRRLDLLQHLTQFSDLMPVVTAPAGGGKTTLLLELERQAGDHWKIARLDGRQLRHANELITQLATAYDIDPVSVERSVTEQLLNHWEFMTRAGQVPVVLVDDADAMPAEILQALLYIGGALKETLAHVRVVLFAATGFEDQLRGNVFLDPKESLLVHSQDIPPLSEEQAASYLAFRLAVAGYTGESPFSATEVREIHMSSDGLPLRINELAHARLALGEVSEQRASESRQQTSRTDHHQGNPANRWAGLSIVLVVLLLVLTFRDDLMDWFFPGRETVTTVAAGTPVPLPIPPLESEQIEPKPVLAAKSEPLPPPEPGPETEPPSPKAPEPMVSDNKSLPLVVAEVPATKRPIEVAKMRPPKPVAVSSESAPVINVEPVVKKEPVVVVEPTRPSVVAIEPPVVKKALEKAPAEERETTVADTARFAPVKPVIVATPSEKSVTEKITTNTTPVLESMPISEVAQASGIQGADWIAGQNPGHVTVQLLGSADKTALQAWVTKKGLIGRVAIHEKSLKGKPWYSVLYGSYPDRAAAAAAIAAMDSNARPKKPWIRTFSSVQAERNPG